MIEKDCCRVLREEEELQYKFKFCELCPLYECELVAEYTKFIESRKSDKIDAKGKSEIVKSEGTSDRESATRESATIRPEVYPVKNSEDKPEDCQCSSAAIDSSYNESIAEPRRIIRVKNVPVKSIIKPKQRQRYPETLRLSYNESIAEHGCAMGGYNSIECGCLRVTEGIGDHYKIETDYDSRIEKRVAGKWETSQPVFISAQTGQGKNYFIEHELIPYVRKHNKEKNIKQKVLIISNRLALKHQIKNRLFGPSASEDQEENIYPYNEFADVMTYQSILRAEKRLEKIQEDKKTRYIYVICDEAHFFTSDAMFNPHTSRILRTLIRLFKSAIRVYMTATPYECFNYILQYEGDHRRILEQRVKFEKQRYSWRVFYHFKRDYSYLDTKTYSEISELYGIIIRSVNEKKEKWLIFIDDKEKCRTVKDGLEKLADEMKKPLVTDKNSKVFAVDADCKNDPVYQEIVVQEKLDTNTYILISTSVLDNGVNLNGISNIVISDMDKVKCIQMVGRARVESGDNRKTLYIKRFDEEYVQKRMKNFEIQNDAYYHYSLAYEHTPDYKSLKGYPLYNFLNKYYNSDVRDWKNAKHWFGRCVDDPHKLYLNEIAESQLEKLIPRYKAIYEEMIEEQKQGSRVGQKYLEYQLSWFGKTYCEDDDITFANGEKNKKELIDFLKSYVENERRISKDEQSEFRSKFTKLSDAAFGRKDRNKNRDYSITKINSILEEEFINYQLESCSSHWVVKEYDWYKEDSDS